MSNSKISQEKIQQSVQNFQKKMAIEYHIIYSKTVISLFMATIFKRYMTTDGVELKDMTSYFKSLFVLVLCSYLYKRNEWTMRIIPFILALISYFAHTHFIFKGGFDLHTFDATKNTMTVDHGMV